jgi:hypothetical protein
MITVYDMTSGTLRKELEERKQMKSLQQTEMHEALHAPGLQLQEIVFEPPVSEEALPEHMLGIKAEDFINSMK